MGRDLPEGVTVLKRPQPLVNIPDPQLHELLTRARDFLTRAGERGYQAGYRLNQAKGMTGEYLAMREVLARLPKGSQSVWVPRRNANVDILDGLIVKPDGSFVVVEAKFQTGGGAPRLGSTNRKVLTVGASGDVTVTKIKGGTTQLSREWLQERIFEIGQRARRLSGQERRQAKQLARNLSEALRAGRVQAMAVSVTEQGAVDVIEDRTRQLQGLVAPGPAATTGTAASPAARGTTPGERGTTSTGVDDDTPPLKRSSGAASALPDEVPAGSSATLPQPGPSTTSQTTSSPRPGCAAGPAGSRRASRRSAGSTPSSPATSSSKSPRRSSSASFAPSSPRSTSR